MHPNDFKKILELNSKPTKPSAFYTSTYEYVIIKGSDISTPRFVISEIVLPYYKSTLFFLKVLEFIKLSRLMPLANLNR